MYVPFIIYADLDSLLEKMSTCHNNPEKSSATKIYKHRRSGYSLFTHCSFDLTKNKLECYRGKYYIIISLSCHEQVCLSGLRFERYFSHHRAR